WRKQRYMKKILGILLIIVVASCQNKPAEPANEPDAIDRSAMDTTVRPQDNFFMYASGTWLKNTVIPPSQSGWGSFFILFDTALSRMHFLVDSLSGLTNTVKNSPAQQVGDLYYSAMDSAGIEKKGIQPLKPELDGIEAISSREGFMDEIAKEWAANH